MEGVCGGCVWRMSVEGVCGECVWRVCEAHMVYMWSTCGACVEG